MKLPVTARDVAEGRRLQRDEDLSWMIFADLDLLCREADRIREYFIGDQVSLCSIINAKSGACSENCKYCAQSVHHHTDCEQYSFLPEEEIVEACLQHDAEGVHRFSLVTSGKALQGKSFEQALHAYETMRQKSRIGLCASMGFLSREQLLQLKAAGVTRYHCNLETSERFFPEICTTHTFAQKVEMIRRVKAASLEVCSGGIIGMGETWEDRISLAFSLYELGADSIPINALMPIKGTQLEGMKRLTEAEILRTVAIFRYINPTAQIRLGAGRALLTEYGKKAFACGASATITGNMLTTAACASIRSDRKMLREMGRC